MLDSAQNAVKLRDACAADAATLCAGERYTATVPGFLVSQPDEFRQEDFAARIALLADGRGKYLVAERDGVLIGHGCLWPMPLVNIAHVVRLDICVYPGFTDDGVGRQLLGALIDWARQRTEVRKIELLVRAGNARAIHLYQSFGFVEEGHLRGRIRQPDGSYMDDLTMALAVI